MATNNIVNNTIENYKFTAYLSSNATAVTGDGTSYDIICDTAQGSSVYNASTGIWTCPETGLYFFGGSVFLLNLTAAFVSGQLVLNKNSYTFQIQIAGNNPGTSVNCTYSGSLVMSCTAGDTVQLQTDVAGPTKTIDLLGGSAQYTMNATSFWGFKV